MEGLDHWCESEHTKFNSLMSDGTFKSLRKKRRIKEMSDCANFNEKNLIVLSRQ